MMGLFKNIKSFFRKETETAVFSAEKNWTNFISLKSDKQIGKNCSRDKFLSKNDKQISEEFEKNGFLVKKLRKKIVI